MHDVRHLTHRCVGHSAEDLLGGVFNGRGAFFFWKRGGFSVCFPFVWVLLGARFSVVLGAKLQFGLVNLDLFVVLWVQTLIVLQCFADFGAKVLVRSFFAKT